MSPKDGCDVVKEATIFNIPVYMTSDSLSTFFKDENNSCKTIQNAENELVRGFSDCCNLENVFGIHKCGKLSIPDIIPLFDKFVEYKLKLNSVQEQELKQMLGEIDLTRPIQNNSELNQTLNINPNLVPIKSKESWITSMKKMFSNSPNKYSQVNIGGKNKKKNKTKKTKKNTKKNKNKSNRNMKRI